MKSFAFGGARKPSTSKRLEGEGSQQQKTRNLKPSDVNCEIHAKLLMIFMMLMAQALRNTIAQHVFPGAVRVRACLFFFARLSETQKTNLFWEP